MKLPVAIDLTKYKGDIREVWAWIQEHGWLPDGDKDINYGRWERQTQTGPYHCIIVVGHCREACYLSGDYFSTFYIPQPLLWEITILTLDEEGEWRKNTPEDLYLIEMNKSEIAKIRIEIGI
jgi:hypothetical protein